MNKNIEFVEELLKTQGITADNPNLLEHVDDRKFRFLVALVNQDGYCMRLRKGAISEMKITDSLMDWFHYGHIIIENPDDIIEKPVSDGQMGLTEAFAEPDSPRYSFRNDARDLLYFFMEPSIDTKDGESPDQLDNQIYTIRMLFTIYKTEDITSNEGTSKKRTKLTFHDYRFQQLLEKNIYYSTAKNLPATANSISGMMQKSVSPRQQDNQSRSKPTGEIIQDILRSAFLENDIRSGFSFDWDMGGTEILYTSPSNYKAINDLEYILNKHTSTRETGYQPSILKLDRYNNVWSFNTLETYYARAKSGPLPGVLQSERYLLSFDANTDSKIIPPETKSFKTGGNMMVNYHFPDLSVIDDYTFVEMDGEDVQLSLNSSVVTRYDEGAKTFYMDMNSAGMLYDQFQKTYISKTLGTMGGPGTAAWNTDSSRSSFFNFNVFDSWSNQKEPSYSVSRNKKLLAGTILGNTIQFYVRGDTTRRSGVWITVDKEYEYHDSAYEDKILGQYFVTHVEHNINTRGEYSNSVMGVKPYTFKPQNKSTTDMLYKNTNVVTPDE